MTDEAFNLELKIYNKYKGVIISVTILLFIIAYILKLDILYGVIIIVIGTTSNIILKDKLRNLYKKGK